jgi:predicted nucleic acid-binding protein
MEFMLDTNICIYLSLTIVTNNVREFQRIPGLRVENWV